MATINLPLSNNNAMKSTDATSVFASNLYVGENNTTTDRWREIIKIDWSTLPVGSIITSAVLKATPTLDRSSNSRIIYAHRVLRTTNFAQITQNVYSTGNSWGNSGCGNATTDYDGSVVLGNGTQPAAPTLNTELDLITFDEVELQKLFDGTYTDNGIVLFLATQIDDLIVYGDKDHATAAYRPRISVTYNLPSSGNFFMFF